jgi:predicted enzyme related to lactoylglutathione lyase
MPSPFVWFHHNGTEPAATRRFLEELVGISATDGPGGSTFLVARDQPFAGLGSSGSRYGDRDEWIPFVAVADVAEFTALALSLGATLVQERTRGPAGEFTVVRDPGGAALALWRAL